MNNIIALPLAPVNWEDSKRSEPKQPPPFASPPIGFIVEAWIESRERRRISDGYLKQIKVAGRRLVKFFPGPLSNLTEEIFLAYLDTLPGKGARTRNNHLMIAKQIARFAKRKNWLAEDWRELQNIEKELETPTEAGIYRPAEITQLLTWCEPEMRPLIVLVAFCGVRTAEAMRLSWSDVDLQRARVTISAARAKTRARRLCPIPANALDWLKMDAREGAIYDGTPRKVQDDRRRNLSQTGVRPIRNGLRHSFISYRVALDSNAAKTALEAGTSETMVFRNYRDVATPEDALAWFDVRPEDAGRVTFTAYSKTI